MDQPPVDSEDEEVIAKVESGKISLGAAEKGD